MTGDCPSGKMASVARTVARSKRHFPITPRVCFPHSRGVFVSTLLILIARVISLWLANCQPTHCQASSRAEAGLRSHLKRRENRDWSRLCFSLCSPDRITPRSRADSNPPSFRKGVPWLDITPLFFFRFPVCVSLIWPTCHGCQHSPPREPQLRFRPDSRR